MNSFQRFMLHAGLALSLAAGLPAAMAQDAKAWPQKTVRIVLPTPPGAPVDIIVRLMQPKLQAAWGQAVVIENKPGAGGNIAMQDVVRSTDGHTILAGPDTMVTVNPHLYKKLGFDPAKDLVPVTYMARFNQMLVCHPGAGFGNLGALLKSTRQKPVTYASSGQGGPSHMAMELLLASTNAKMVHVPYRGPTPAAMDVVGGQVQCGFIASTVVLPFVKDGRLMPLAVSGGARSPQAPTVPTIAEDAVVGFDATFFETLQVPASVPKPVVEKIRNDVAQLLLSPEMKAKLLELDLVAVANAPAEASRRGVADYAKWGRIAKIMNLALD
ncbi:MAG TPA: tripartite tricarboxylate transporter substrate-binding protein [Ramlibacter sp.]|nr:tripartite tricarboxylate transporter substrate-binding protein [Ramlibacter sp.]